MSFPRYPTYKPSGVEWLGEVPEHWEVKKIRNFASFTGGGTPSRENLSFWGGPIPWVSPKDMKVERIIEAEEGITQEGLDGSSSSLVAPGHVLIVVRSGILRHTIPVAINAVEVAINQDMKAVRMDDKVCTNIFFLRWIQGLNNQLLLAWAKQGATVESVEQEYLSKTVLPLPTLAEQAAIATFLDHETAKIDALIAEQQRLIELLQEKRQAVISHAVTKGLNPDAPMKDSGVEWLGEVPEHWEKSRLRALFRQEKRQDQPTSPVLSVYRDYGVILKDSRDDNHNKTPESLSAYQLVNRDDLVVNKMKAWQGSLGVSVLHGITSPDYAVFTPHHNEFSLYLHFLLRSCRMTSVYRSISNGIRPAQWRIEPGVFLDLPVFLPPTHEQELIAGHVSRESEKFDQLVKESESFVNLLQERRSALISAVVTGQIDVRGLVPEVEAA